MLCILIFVLLVKASASQIMGSGNTTAEYGSEARYRCTLENPKGVLQVTWQRLFRDESIENLATYSNRFGEQVNGPYRGKVIFTEASLSSTSITLRNISWQDESCYICSFNVYPDGSKRKQTCLTVEGISMVNTMYVTRSGPEEEDREVVFSCSATGKPAPTIEWVISPGATNLDEPQTTIEANSDHTFTSSCNVTLQVPLDWKGHVDCLLNKGVRGQRQERIPFSLGAWQPKNKREGRRASSIALAVTLVILLPFIIIAAVMWKKRLRVNRTNENV